MRLLLSSFLALCMLTGCARSPVVPPEPVTRIKVIPAAPIAKRHTENKGLPLGVLWYSLADRIKSSDFNERMEPVRKDMGPKLTAALVRQLNALPRVNLGAYLVGPRGEDELYDKPQEIADSDEVAADALALKIAQNIRAQTAPASAQPSWSSSSSSSAR